MLASDSDTESADWDSDSDGSENGPLKQAWGSKNLRQKKADVKFDFAANPPQDGEEFLMAVLQERKQTPSCVAADKAKLDEIKKRRSATGPGSEQEEQRNEGNAGQEEGRSSDVVKATAGASSAEADLESKLEGINAEETEETKSQAPTDSGEKTEPDVQEAARFLPTPKWRANRINQFNYIRIKMDLMRDMILQGKVYFVSSFTKFERERIYWLRYCFGTLDAAKMIEMKRAKKIRAKEVYDAKKKLQGGGGGADSKESQDESPDSDVEFVSTEEVTNLSKTENETKPAEGEDDDLMKISGGSLDELVVVPSQSTQPPAEEPGKEKDAGEEKEKKESVVDSSQLNSNGQEDAALDAVVSDINDLSIAGESVKAQDPHTAAASASASVIPEPVKDEGEEEFVDPLVEHRRLHGHTPTTNLLLSMPQRLTEYLLTLQLDWLKEFGLINRKQGNWLFATMTSLQVPFEPDVISDLRLIAHECVKIRELAKRSVLQSGVPMDERPSSEILEELTSSPINSGDASFGLEDVISSCNLFIAIVVDYFVQKDLNNYLTLADGEEL